MPALYDYIQADATLKAHATIGSDGAIAAALNAIDPAIQITRESIPPDYLRAMAVAAMMTASQSGDAALAAKWQGAVVAASGFQDEIKLSDPVLGIQLAAASADGVLSQEITDYYTKRPGSIAEREFGRAVSVDDVSAALSTDRTGGKV